MEERWIEGGRGEEGGEEWEERRDERLWSGCKINKLINKSFKKLKKILK